MIPPKIFILFIIDQSSKLLSDALFPGVLTVDMFNTIFDFGYAVFPEPVSAQWGTSKPTNSWRYFFFSGFYAGGETSLTYTLSSVFNKTFSFLIEVMVYVLDLIGLLYTNCTFIIDALLLVENAITHATNFVVAKAVSTAFKFLLCICFLIFARGGIPRYRFDYLTRLGWIRFLSLVLLSFLVELLILSML